MREQESWTINVVNAIDRIKMSMKKRSYSIIHALSYVYNYHRRCTVDQLNTTNEIATAVDSFEKCPAE